MPVKSGESMDHVCSIFATMRYPPVLARTFAFVVASACLSACAGPREPAGGPPPPRSEFLLSSADSTFWISTTDGKARTRGAPLMLARYDGRFYELFTADDDFSYEDALLLGERLYRRDLVSGDSAVVFADTTVARVANAYARAHPDEDPLRPDDDGAADPATSATAEVDVLDVFGPYVSFEYRVDIDLPGRQPWHSTRRGVLDLRSGKPASVAELFGSAAAGRIESSGRRLYEGERDSILRSRANLDADDRRAAAALARLHFDERSFILSDVNGRPAVAFSVPGAGEGPAGHLIELDPIAADSAPPAWWPEVRPGLSITDDQGSDRWTGAGYTILARYDTSGGVAHLSIGDSANREWPLAAVTAPLRRIDWLDRPAMHDADRRALTRAFNEAANYSEATRVATARTQANLSLVTRSGTSHASGQARQRQSARNIRAHDARSCEQPGPRVRRSHSFDDGQVRCHLGAAAHPDIRGHRVDRPRRLSRTDLPGRPGRHAGERQLRGTNVDGSWCPRRGGGPRDRQTPPHKLVLFDLRCG